VVSVRDFQRSGPIYRLAVMFKRALKSRRILSYSMGGWTVSRI